MRHFLLSIIAVPVVLIVLFNLRLFAPDKETPRAHHEEAVAEENYRIYGTVRSNETFESIFSKHDLDRGEFYPIYNESKKEYDLARITVGSIYSFELDRDENAIQSMQFGIDDLTYLHVTREAGGFAAEKVTLPVTIKTGMFFIEVENNLISSMPGTHRVYLELALALSDIYAWDIDFSNDIRNGDMLKLIVEEQWVGDVFRGYGDILAAEFINNGKIHRAYRFESEGHVDYFDEAGKSLRKSLLRSPLRFKYISSGFSKRRLHPILRRYRPHLGIDYAAPKGTPVSAAGSGTIMFAGYKGQNGKMVKIKHPGDYITYYGHLSRIPNKIRKGKKVSQGDIIGYVGSTGLSTGPHLDYRMKRKGKFVNPLKIRLPRGKSVAKRFLTEFMQTVRSYDGQLAMIAPPVLALDRTTGKSGEPL